MPEPRPTARNTFPAWIAAAAALHCADVRACPSFVSGIQQKISEYTAYRERNQEVLDRDLGTEKGCTEQGASISMAMAKAADAYTCKAEADASGVDKKMSELGANCEERFRKIHDFQVDLHARYDKVKSEVEYTMAYLNASGLLSEECQDKVAFANQLLQKFEELEGRIVSVEDRANDGKTSYGKFKDTAAQLKSLTGNLGKGCGGVQEAFAALAKGLSGKGSHDPVPRGRSPGSASDVTGLKKDVRIGSGGASTTISRPRPGADADAAGAGKAAAAPGASPSRVTSDPLASFVEGGDLDASSLAKREPTAAHARGAGRSDTQSVGASIWNVSESENSGIQFKVDEGAARAPSSETPNVSAEGTHSGGEVQPVAVQALPLQAEQAGSGVAASSATKAIVAEDLFSRVTARYRSTSLFLAPKP